MIDLNFIYVYLWLLIVISVEMKIVLEMFIANLFVNECLQNKIQGYVVLNQ